MMFLHEYVPLCVNSDMYMHVTLNVFGLILPSLRQSLLLFTTMQSSLAGPQDSRILSFLSLISP